MYDVSHGKWGSTMMKTIFPALAIILFCILAIIGCTELKTDLPTPTNGTFKIHEAGWNDATSGNFHGTVLKTKDFKLDDCVSCHAKSFEGGTSGISCFTCHDAFPHSTKFPGIEGHVSYMSNNGFLLAQCQDCHGSSYDGGVVGATCTNSGCHVNSNGPEACNTCHGDFYASANDTISWAPPRSILGDTLDTAHGVGAHQAHLAEGELSNLIKCNQCHNVPATFYSPGHLNTQLQAEVVFNTSLAGLATANHTFIPNPVYDNNTSRCSNAYCHGNWHLQRPQLPSDTSRNFAYTDTVMAGSNYSPLWTGGGQEIECGTCHGLPPTGHKDFHANCFACHDQRDDMDKTKHINGKVNIFGTERNF
jgi:hypothetical protein